MKKNDRFKLQYPGVRTSAASVVASNVSKKIWKSIMDKYTEAANAMLSLLLILRGKKYAVASQDGKISEFTEEETLNSLLALKRGHSIPMSDDDFVAAARHIYNQFSYAKNGRSFANLFFNDDEGLALGCLVPGKKESDKAEVQASNAVIENARVIARSTIFPIAQAKMINEESGILKYAISKDVSSKLSSMEEIQDNYDAIKDTWNVKANSSGLPHIDRYREFVYSLQTHPSFKNFEADNFKRFLNNWRGQKVYTNRERTEFTRKPGIYDAFTKLPQDHVFQESDRAKYRYCAELLNMMFRDYRDLWADPENNEGFQYGVIGHNDYASLIIEFYHWRKDCVIVSLFGKDGKRCGVILGNNGVPFTIKQDNGKTTIVAATSGFASIKAPANLILSHRGYIVETELIYTKKKEEKELSPEEIEAINKENIAKKIAKDQGEEAYRKYKADKKAQRSAKKDAEKKAAADLAVAAKAEAKAKDEKEIAEAKAKGKAFFAEYKAAKAARRKEEQVAQAEASKQKKQEKAEQFKVKSEIPEEDFGNWEATGNYRVRYSRDSKHLTWYTGEIKEPVLRLSGKNGRLYVDLPISNHKVEGVPEDPSITSFKWLLSTSAPFDKRAASVESPRFSYNAMGVDFGVENPFVATIAKVVDGEIQEILGVEKSIRSKSCMANKDKYLSLCEIADAACVLIRRTVEYIREKSDDINAVTTHRNNPVHISKILGINMEEYLAFCAPFRSRQNKEEALRDLKRKESNWVVGRIVKKLKRDLSEIRSEYSKAENKKEYCETEGQVDVSLFHKRRLVKKYISLARSLSFVGFDNALQSHIDDANLLRKTFANDYQEYYRGLTRLYHMTLASDIVSVARKSNVMAIFVEDFRPKFSLEKSEEENVFQAEMGIGEFYKALADNASKHQIAVLGVSEEYTSQIDPVTGTFGYNEGRNLYVKRNGSIVPVSLDRDEAASQNILARGVSRNSDIRTFRVDCIDDTAGSESFRLNMSAVSEDDSEEKVEFSKRKMGSLFTAIGSTECIFRRNAGGSFDVISTELTAEQKNIPAIPLRDEHGRVKRLEMWRDGNGGSARWMLRDEIKREIATAIGGVILSRETEPQTVNV